MSPVTTGAAAIVVGALVALSIPEPSLSGRAAVVDGDTLRLGDHRIRLWGIDAPERSQTCHFPDRAYQCGEVATEELRRRLHDPVNCVQKDKDRYGRVVAQCFVNGQDVGGLLVARGWAVDYKRYSQGYYKDHEAAAKVEQLGMWAGTFTMPEQYRHEQK